MTKRNAVKKSRAGRREKTGLQAIVWSALTLTGQLVAHIKNVQLGYLRVGAGLAKVRDSKIYEVLSHLDSAVIILTTEQQVAKAGLHLLSLPVDTTTAALA